MASKKKATEIEKLVVWGSGHLSSSSPKATVTADIFDAMAVQRDPLCNTLMAAQLYKCTNGKILWHGTAINGRAEQRVS